MTRSHHKGKKNLKILQRSHWHVRALLSQASSVKSLSKHVPSCVHTSPRYATLSIDRGHSRLAERRTVNKQRGRWATDHVRFSEVSLRFDPGLIQVRGQGSCFRASRGRTHKFSSRCFIDPERWARSPGAMHLKLSVHLESSFVNIHLCCDTLPNTVASGYR